MSVYSIIERVNMGEFEPEHKPTHITATRNSQEYLDQMDEAKKNREWNRQAELGKREAFRKTLAEAYGISDHPKEDLLWRMAWSRGHANGYAEVASEYDELVELIK